MTDKRTLMEFVSEHYKLDLLDYDEDIPEPDVKMIKELCEKCEDIDEVFNDMNALASAVRYQHLNIIEILLNNGASTEFVNEDESNLLFMASLNRFMTYFSFDKLMKITDILVKRDRKLLNYKRRRDGCSLINYYCMDYIPLEVIKHLISLDPDLGVINNSGSTIIHSAAYSRNLEAFECIIDDCLRSNPHILEIRDSDGRTVEDVLENNMPADMIYGDKLRSDMLDVLRKISC